MKMNYYKEITAVFDRWAKDYQTMPKGHEKELMKVEMEKAVDILYGKVNIISQKSE